ncbi:MAG TPA: hydrolase [Bacteroidales bacterium]|jgi:nicotinamidase-related amidase|nr:hydrolase [Bacteroidales bacterium]NLH33270.1 hydrolase [Lentimicrobium sp.]OQC36478.1 MAG: nicotinamidase/pyrazinamidase [Bacteroidetes bacterium ADurb.Bin041]MBP7874782.1 hydrolase [Bacteroidales bacterium]MCZ2282372.1 hydrolase [Bacteroidales bacterium]
MRILANESLGLIIDIQEKLYPFIKDNEQITRNTAILIEGLKAIGVNIMVTEQYPKGLGFTIEPLKQLVSDIPVIEKTAFSCCDDQLFSKEFSKHQIKNVIIAGIETHVCVLQTTIDLLKQGYQPVVIEDCVGSRSLNDKALAIERMRQEGAIISTYESILFELLRFSGTDVFKKISKLVK